MTKQERKKRFTFVFLTIDAHGHVNSMMGLADELRQLGHRTVFICSDSSIPRKRGHEMYVLNKGEEAKNAQLIDGDIKVQVNGEESVFFNSNSSIEKWNDLICSTNTDASDEKSLIKMLTDNYKLTFKFTKKEVISNDKEIERILLETKPDLVVLDLVSPFPCVRRLENDLNYCKKVGWFNGEERKSPLLWMGFMSCSPMTLYHHYGLKRFPPPLMGLSARMEDREEILKKHEIMVKILREARVPELRRKLALMSNIKNADKLSEEELMFGKFALNISNWFNVYMFPSVLDYAGEQNVYLPKDKWLQANSIIRRPLAKNININAHDNKDELFFKKILDWKRDGNESLKIVYISMGTTMSLKLQLMKNVLKQMFACLSLDNDLKFILALGARGNELKLLNDANLSIKDQLERWQEADRLIASNWIPQPELLQRKLIDVCVTHGGNNTICEVFQYKVPHLVVIAGLYDQLDNARRVEELDLGVSLKSSQFYDTSNQPADLLYKSIKESLKLLCCSPQVQNGGNSDEEATRNGGVLDHDEQERNSKFVAKVILSKLESHIFRMEA